MVKYMKRITIPKVLADRYKPFMNKSIPLS